MAGGGGSTGGIGAQSPASGGYGGGMGFGGNMGNASARGFGGGYGGGMGFGGQPQRPMGGGQMMVGYGGTAENGYQTPGGFGGFGMERPQVVGGFGGIEQDQEFLGYQKQSEDLSRQMNEYMQKAPMYQQLQDLQGKMRGVQSKYAPPQRSFNQAPQGQLGGLAGLLGGLGGMGGYGGGTPFMGHGPSSANYNPSSMLFGGLMPRPSYDAHVAHLSRVGALGSMPSREEYENPVQRQVNPTTFG